jgi:hypothetical protein
VVRILRAAPTLFALNVTLVPSIHGSVENRSFNVNLAGLVSLDRAAHDKSKEGTQRVRVCRRGFSSFIVDKLMTSVLLPPLSKLEHAF